MDDERLEEIEVIEEVPSVAFNKYVVDFPEKLDDLFRERAVKAVCMIFSSELEKAEKDFEKLYDLIRKEENQLQNGQRFHKGGVLYWWGFSLLFQEAPEKVSKGYEKLLLAYIEDLIDFVKFQDAINGPASTALLTNPAIGESLLTLVQHKVKQMLAEKHIPKNPEETLKTLSNRTNKVLEKPIDITFAQIKPVIQQWLKQCGKKEKRVFIGGNYLNIAVLRLIESAVQNFDFVPIMPINFPETSMESNEKWIHDISMEVMKECSYAIFEVTFSNGHLMEIERAKDFKLNTILVYQTTKHGKKPMVTSMLLTTSFEKKGYRNFDELRPIIYSFLA